ncbi:AAA family ATPase [Actinoplanes bogorensis]|uniref:AAA family ATPase n=1 Tax=Paractinoplanes bogorensis TaxID=1610840 RepID=A0ABS5YJN3_9ACTN|nr:BTAD domain-containing putative transcriptional regulator [Actinoplanes bogorensis]MBU2663608.1 AAA family ATPase [Actinoplanes bogorensis]
MKVTLLGPVGARSGDTELALGGLKQRAVFAMLALSPGRVVPVDRLIDEVWGEEPPARATLALQSYVSRLRRLLGEVPDGPRIVTRPPGWVLTLEPGQVDVARFEDLVAAAHGQAAAEAVATLRAALDLWTGDALADLSTLAFARAEAVRLGEVRLSAAELLLEARLAAGEHETVVPPARQFVTANPYRERGWHALMIALYRAGRHAEAVAAAAELRRTFADDLGLDPSPETADLERRMLRHDADLAPAGPPVLATVSAAEVTVVPRVVGRHAAMAVLDDAVAAAGRGRGQLLVLDAPAGSGKSTMLRVLADRVRAAGGVAVRASSAGGGSMPALWPWVSIVRDVTGPQHDDLWARAGEGELSRTRLFRDVIDRLASVPGLAVLLDDVHWADAETLTLLSLAVDALAAHGTLFAVAVRSDEPGAATVRELLGRTSRELVTRVELPGLTADAIAELVGGVSGTAAEPGLVRLIRQRTSGNPLFVNELVRLLTSERRLDVNGVRDALPEQVQEVLRRRIERLPEQTVVLLSVVALTGGSADIELLADVTGLDAGAVLDGCEAALLAGLLEEAGGGFGLSHDLVRQTLERDLSGPRRIRWHARLASSLREREPLTPELVVAVARHLRLAAPLVGPEAAVPYLVAVSEDALSRYANDQAGRTLEDALELIASVRDPVVRSALDGQVRGRLMSIRGWTAGAVPRETRTRESAFPRPLPADGDSAASWLSTVVMGSMSGSYEWAVAAAEEVLAAGVPPVGRIAAQFTLVYAELVLGRTRNAADAYAVLDRMLTTEPEARISGLLASTVPVLAAGYGAVIAHIQGDETAADARLADARRRAGDVESHLVEVELAHCWVAGLRGDPIDAATHAAACLELATRVDFPLNRLHARIIGGWAAALTGDPSGATEADDAYADYAGRGLRFFNPFFLMLRAEAHRAAGDPATAIELERAGQAGVTLAPRFTVA